MKLDTMYIKSTIATLALVAFIITTEAQTKLPQDQSGAVRFDSVVVVDSVKAIDLYNRALAWFGANFKSPKDAIQMQIPESKTIVANGITALQWPMLGGNLKSKLGFKITIICKDNRYRYTIENLTYYDQNYKEAPSVISKTVTSNSKGAEKARQNIIQSINDLVVGLNSQMIKKDNW
jgi:hypothetical protein